VIVEIRHSVTRWRDAVVRRRAVLLDVAVAAVTTGIEIGLLVDGWPGWTATAVVLSVLTGATLVLRRRSPLAVLAATLAGTAVVVAVSGGGFPGGAPVVVALFTVAERRDRWTAVAVLVPAAVLLQVWAVAQPAVSVIAVIAGAYLQTRRRYTAALEERAAQLEREREQLNLIAAQRERASIARDLHDIVAHSVTVMLLGARGARDVLHTRPDVADDVLRRVEAGGEESLAELRRILAVLREPAGRPGGELIEPAELAPAPSLDRLPELVGHFHAAGLPVRLQIDGDRRPLPGGLELSAYRIVEEALTNVAKHARATDVAVHLRYRRDGLEVRVEDDGEPRHPAPGEPGAGRGILGMRERAVALGGRLEAGVRPGGGFQVAADLPAGGAA
jgi:signal transduction histidine kinase